MQFQDDILEKAENYIRRIEQILSSIEGNADLLEMIKKSGSIDQKKDYLASFILASFFASGVKKIVFEEKCKKHPSKGPHDLVVYLTDGTRVVNEIKRLKQTGWDQYEEDNLIQNSVKRTGKLYQFKENPNRTTTSFFDTILTEIEKKKDQLDPNENNIIWITSKGNHYTDIDIEDAAFHYKQGWNFLSSEQPGKFHKKPEDLSAVGWFWDGDPFLTSKKAKCFLIADLKLKEKLNEIADIDFY